MHGERKVVAHPGDVILCCCFNEQGVGTGAVRALKVFKLDEGHARTRGWAQGRGIMHAGSLRRPKLGVSVG